MASTVRRPIPGSANTLSVTTTPPIRSASPTPMMVTTGSEAFLRAWPRSTAARRQALGVGGADVVLPEHTQHARAGHARDERHVDEADSVSAGRMSWRRNGQRPCGERLSSPARAAQPSWMAKTHTRRKPSQNTGMEKPDTAKTMTERSIQEPCLQAASTPSGTASGDRNRAWSRTVERDGRLDALTDQGGDGEPGEDRRARGRRAAHCRARCPSCTSAAAGRARALARILAMSCGVA